MLFNSLIFLLFLVTVVPLFVLLQKVNHKKLLLLISSYVFYGYWDWRFCILLLLSTVMDFYLGLWIEDAKDDDIKKKYLTLSLITNLGLLGFFKYFNFFVESFSSAFGVTLDFVHLNVLLPVGISFYTFQSLSYTFDIYRKRMHASRSVLDYAVYVSFFPQLVAGPIEKAIDLLPQVVTLKNPTKTQFKEGLALITSGMFLKVMVGDTIGKYVDHIFTEPTYYKSGELLSALILFSIQIYADFCGYSKIAQGCGKFLGVSLLQNFNQPYLASNIADFWRRWHISLSSWLKDYVYIWWLGGNSKGKVRTYVNLILTMLIGGLWHGANWTFVIWGGIHGCALVIYKYLLGENKPMTQYSYTGVGSLLTFIVSIFLTYCIVLFAWLFFRAPDFSTAGYFLSHIFHWTSSNIIGEFIRVVIIYGLVVIALDAIEYYTARQDYLNILKPALRYGIMIPVWVIIVLYMYSVVKPAPFIYFQF